MKTLTICRMTVKARISSTLKRGTSRCIHLYHVLAPNLHILLMKNGLPVANGEMSSTTTAKAPSGGLVT
jgi:hypothetical protein